MSGNTQTTLTRLRRRRAAWLWIGITALVIFLILPKELLIETLHRLARMGPYHALRYMWVRNRGPLYGLAIFTGLALLVLLSALRIAALSRRIAREPANIPVNKPEPPRAAPSKKTGDPKVVSILVIVVTALMAIFAAMDSEMLFPALGTALLTLVIAAIATAVNRKKTGADRPPVLRTQTEEAVSCSHRVGREKYIDQLDSYLKAGLIDRAEYKALKERYKNMDIPSDYH